MSGSSSEEDTSPYKQYPHPAEYRLNTRGRVNPRLPRGTTQYSQAQLYRQISDIATPPITKSITGEGKLTFHDTEVTHDKLDKLNALTPCTDLQNTGESSSSESEEEVEAAPRLVRVEGTPRHVTFGNPPQLHPYTPHRPGVELSDEEVEEYHEAIEEIDELAEPLELSDDEQLFADPVFHPQPAHHRVFNMNGDGENENVGAERPTMTYPGQMPSFSGNPEEDPDEFVLDCETYSRFMFNGTHNRLIQTVPSMMSGLARRWYKAREAAIHTWVEFRREFLGNFAIPIDEKKFKGYVCPKKPGEATDAFCRRFQDHAWSHGISTDAEMKTTFMSNIPDSLRQQIQILICRDPDRPAGDLYTWPALVAVAKKAEKRTRVVHESDPTDKALLKQLMKDMKDMKLSKKSSTKMVANVSTDTFCYQCCTVGHSADECNVPSVAAAFHQGAGTRMSYPMGNGYQEAAPVQYQHPAQGGGNSNLASCQYCGKLGHDIDVCFKRINMNNKPNPQQHQQQQQQQPRPRYQGPLPGIPGRREHAICHRCGGRGHIQTECPSAPVTGTGRMEVHKPQYSVNKNPNVRNNVNSQQMSHGGQQSNRQGPGPMIVGQIDGCMSGAPAPTNNSNIPN